MILTHENMFVHLIRVPKHRFQLRFRFWYCLKTFIFRPFLTASSMHVCHRVAARAHSIMHEIRCYRCPTLLTCQ